ncbi:probable cytochrome P450 67 [Ramularia collo-cygni]|uniref:Probable cytochrome P450 67 n=1 Tax=Ramularia collo-cygni TaxID=112498 RepID=A0A2D3UZT1_9PEZI|nr:probable cytochrome P450 67 [Ramularia collo-cygni]CZT14739.1 probable cytochrome P450 67 [Ramularia collo-cygni]
MFLSSALAGSPVGLLSLSLGGLAIYALGVIVYRLYFHPLAKYPGPLVAKLTDLYSTYHALRGDRHLEFWRCHEKYGNVVRFGPNSLSFNSNTALKDIYGFKSNARKADFYKAFWASKDSASTHSSIDKSIHARKRRVLSHAFSDAAIKSYENHILAHIRQFCQNLAGLTSFADSQTPEKKGYGQAIDVADQANYLTFDIMGDLCFGKAFGMLERPDNRFAIDLIGNAAHRHLICGTYLPIHDYHLDKLFFRKIAAGRARYMQYSKGQAAERMKMGMDVDRKDFFYHLLKAKDPETGAGFTTPELWGESNLLIIAGSDTTSTALAATIFYLVHHPEALRKVTQEVRSAFEDVEDIRIGATLSSLHYVRACVDEAMRMSPSVGGILPREVLAGGMDIDGLQIPAGTVVGVPHYTLQHNSAYYPAPFEYKPERWMAGSSNDVTADTVAVTQSAFCPFSVGPRGCIGKSMAYAEMTTTLARIVHMYDMRLAPGSTAGEGKASFEYGRHRSQEYQLKDCFTSMKEGPLVQFRARS